MITVVITIEPHVHPGVFRNTLRACAEQGANMKGHYLAIVVDLQNSVENERIVQENGEGKVLYLSTAGFKTTAEDGTPLTLGAVARNYAARIVNRGRILFLDADCIPEAQCLQAHDMFGSSGAIAAGALTTAMDPTNSASPQRDPRVMAIPREYHRDANSLDYRLQKLPSKLVWVENMSVIWNYFDCIGGFWEFGKHSNMGCDLATRWCSALSPRPILSFGARARLMRKHQPRPSEAIRDQQRIAFLNRKLGISPDEVPECYMGLFMPSHRVPPSSLPEAIQAAAKIFPARNNPNFTWDNPNAEPPKPKITFKDADYLTKWCTTLINDSNFAFSGVNTYTWGPAILPTDGTWVNVNAIIQEAPAPAAPPPQPELAGVVFPPGVSVAPQEGTIQIGPNQPGNPVFAPVQNHPDYAPYQVNGPMDDDDDDDDDDDWDEDDSTLDDEDDDDGWIDDDDLDDEYDDWIEDDEDDEDY